ncbi:MAG: glycosyltransferase family 2 protein [Nitrospinae bacterium]|nr:glycosyltransferase family 2 protein [Nitrospinota bacterium]
MVECSVIIVNWNGGETILNCLRSLHRFEKAGALEIIISDNGSTDGSPSAIEKEFPAARVLRNGHNHGFAGGVNRGLAHATGKYALILNPDMEFIEPGLEKLLGTLDADPAIGLCGCVVLNADGSFMKQCRRGYPDPLTALYKVTGLSALFPQSAAMAKYFYGGAPEDAPLAVDAVSGSFMLARRDALKKAGGLGEEYFMYVEDVDICKKVRQAGYRVMYLPLMKIMHHGGACVGKRERRGAFYHYHMTRSHIVLYAKDRMVAGGGIGWHIAFALILLRYALLSLIHFNMKFPAHVAEFFAIHAGNIGPARHET